ncbi:hypothetical protein Gpo141_00013437, partial [Globisporangium polare]
AAWNGRLDVVKFLHENRTEGCTVSAMNTAAAFGHLEVVKFLHENRAEGCTTDAMGLAALNGHFEVVLFLHANRRESCTRDCVDDVETCVKNLEMVQWLHSNYHGALNLGFMVSQQESMGAVFRHILLRAPAV